MSSYANDESSRKKRNKRGIPSEDVAAEPDSKGRAWTKEIQVAQKDHKEFYDVGDKVIDRYMDECGASGAFESKKEKFNILWSNIQLLGPAIYNRTPKPQVERRFKDKDQVGRVGASILERAVTFAVDDKTFDPVMRQVRDDYLLTARGVARIWYDPTFGKDEEEQETLEFEEVYPKYVHWKDFLHQPARFWEEVSWVAFRSYLSKDAFKSRFPDIDIKTVKFDKSSGQYTQEGSDSRKDADDNVKKCEVWEIWDKETKTVYWLAVSTARILDSQADPLELKSFFPCPRPIIGTHSNNSCIPYPDFKFYQDQASQLDEMTCRRAGLVRGLKMMGVYDESISELDQLINESVESDLIPVKNWMQVQQMGGLSGVMDFLPIEQTANVYTALVNNTNVVKNEVYEITGISDIVRGLSDARETAAAQQIKGQYANLRLSDKQGEMARFCRDIVALMGEVIAEKFSPQTILAMAGVEEMEPQDLQYVQPALELLRNDSMRQFRVDIQTDSTVNIDEAGEKEARVEFTNMMTQWVDKIQQVGGVAPEVLPLMAEFMLFSARGFKVGRSLEGAIEDSLNQLKEKVAAIQAQGPQPSPEQMKAQAEMQNKQQELELKKQEAMVDAEIKKAESAAKIQMQREEAAAKLQIEKEKSEKEYRLKAQAQRQQAGLNGQTRKRAVVGMNAQGEREVQIVEESVAPPPAPEAPVFKRAVMRKDPQGNRMIDVFEGDVLTQQGILGTDEQGNPIAEVVELQ